MKFRTETVITLFSCSTNSWLIGCAFALGLVLSPTISKADSVKWAEAAGGTSSDGANSITVDSSGGVYVTGGYHGPAIFGDLTLPSSNNGDIFLAKYSTDGTALWVKSAGGPLFDDAFSVTVDTAGNSYVSGAFKGSAIFDSFTVSNVDTAEHIPHMFVAKYDANGSVLWARAAESATTAGDGALDIAVDAQGNVYVAGDYDGVITIGSSSFTSVGSFDMLLVKYDPDGNPLWARSAGGIGFDGAWSLALDAAGNCYLRGVYSDTITFGSLSLTSDGQQNIFLAKYDPSGSVMWAESIEGAGTSSKGIAVDADENIFVAGSYQGTVTFGSLSLTSNPDSSDFFLAKYDTNGNALWVRSAAGLNANAGGAVPKAVAVDSVGNIQVLGVSSGTVHIGSFTLTAVGSNDIFLANFDSDGNVMRALSFGSVEVDKGFDLAVDDSGNSYIAGLFQDTANFESIPLNTSGSSDIFIAKIGPVQGSQGAVPAVSEWGMIVMSLLILSSVTIMLRRREGRVIPQRV